MSTIHPSDRALHANIGSNNDSDTGKSWENISVDAWNQLRTASTGDQPQGLHPSGWAPGAIIAGKLIAWSNADESKLRESLSDSLNNPEHGAVAELLTTRGEALMRTTDCTLVRPSKEENLPALPISFENFQKLTEKEQQALILLVLQAETSKFALKATDWEKLVNGREPLNLPLRGAPTRDGGSVAELPTTDARIGELSPRMTEGTLVRPSKEEDLPTLPISFENFQKLTGKEQQALILLVLRAETSKFAVKATDWEKLVNGREPLDLPLRDG